MPTKDFRSRVISHRAPAADVVAVLDAYLARRLPETVGADTLPGVDRFPVSTRYEDPGRSEYIYVSEESGKAGGLDAPTTEIHFSIIFDEPNQDTPTVAEAAAVRRRVTGLVNAIEAKIRREVPVLFTKVTETCPSPPGEATGVAWTAADHLDDPAIFRALVERDTWTGVVAAPDGTPVHLSLTLTDDYEGDVPGRRLFTADASIRGEHFTRLGEPAATELTAATVAPLMQRLRGETEHPAPTLESLEVHAGPVTLPRLFYETGEALGGFVARMTGRAIGDVDTSGIVIAPEPGLRAELGVTVDAEDDGTVVSNVTVALERVNREMSPAEVAGWQESADNIAAALVSELQTEVAPSFSVGAPIETVATQVRGALAAMFPSDETNDFGDSGYMVSSFELGEDVYGSIYVHLEQVGEWETRVTFTGGLYGSALSDNPHELGASKAAFRQAIVNAAAQMRTEFVHDIVQIPPQSGRPNVGLE